MLYVSELKLVLVIEDGLYTALRYARLIGNGFEVITKTTDGTTIEIVQNEETTPYHLGGCV